MAESQLNKALYTNMTRLQLCNTPDAPCRFRLEKSPFPDDDDDDAMAIAPKTDTYFIIGRIYPNSEIFNQGAFQIEMKLTKNFPMEPPEVRFLTPIYHPNVDKKDGK
jgi:ubiquitin-protein ligase